jgi:stress-induced morphogen
LSVQPLDNKSKLGKFLLKASPEEIAKLLKQCEDKINIQTDLSIDNLANFTDPAILVKLGEAKIILSANEKKASKASSKGKFSTFIDRLSKSAKYPEAADELVNFLNATREFNEAQKDPLKWLQKDPSHETYVVMAESMGQVLVALAGEEFTDKDKVEQSKAIESILINQLNRDNLNHAISSDALKASIRNVVETYAEEVLESAKKIKNPPTVDEIFMEAKNAEIAKSLTKDGNKEKGSAKLLKELIDKEIENARANKQDLAKPAARSSEMTR